MGLGIGRARELGVIPAAAVLWLDMRYGWSDWSDMQALCHALLRYHT